MRRGYRAFTLIELLVVVAIIALLIAILAPSLGAARRQTRAVVCGTNLRQVGIGWLLYAEQHQDFAVAARPATLAGNNVYFVGNGWKYRPRWLTALGAAVQIYSFTSSDNQPRSDSGHQSIDNSLLVCPEVSDRTSERNSSYGYNYQFLGNARLQNGGSGGFINYPVRAGSIFGARTVIAADCLGTAADFAAGERGANRADGSNDHAAAGNHAYMLDPPRLTDSSDRCNGGLRSAPDERHASRASFVFGDGHVQLLAASKLGYRLEGDGRFAIADIKSDNTRFSGDGTDSSPPPISE